MEPCLENTDAVVLVIDDEALIRQSITTYLEDSGFTVLQADDGPGGLNLIKETQPDVVLLDLRMPEMDGLEVLARVTDDWPHIPVVVVTGAGVLKDAIEALRLGAFDYISKPISDMALLDHAICRALEMQRLVAENDRYHRQLETEVTSRTQELAQRSAQLADVIAIFEGFIYTVDSRYRLHFMNSKLKAHTHQENAEGLCHVVIYGTEAPCEWCPMQLVLKGETHRCELQNPQDHRWYHGVYSPQADDRGAIDGCQAIVMDIHDRKVAEINLHLESERLQAHNLRLRHSLKGAVRFGDIIGRSDAMHAVYQSILKSAESNANVIIYGESGSGKELVAQTIHRLSDRGDNAFVPVNCGAIPDRLFESEFFGYKKGAFTGADQDKEGFLSAAQGGTLFLDEVGEVPPGMQVKLLRAIDGGGFTPLGSHESIPTDIRIVAATNRDLQHLVAQGQFRKDFYYRIHVVPISVPPLRERREDIPLLIQHFLQLLSQPGQRQSIPDKVIQAMLGYHWPGNVRELQNAVQQYVTLQDVDVIGNLPVEAEKLTLDEVAAQVVSTRPPDLRTAVRKFEKRYIELLLHENQWHRSRVAGLLRVDRRTLLRKVRALGIK